MEESWFISALLNIMRIILNFETFYFNVLCLIVYYVFVYEKVNFNSC